MSRRGHGEGDIHQRPDGRWEARITLDERAGPDGKKRQIRKSFYGKTRKEVAKKMDEYRNARRNGVGSHGRDVTLHEWLQYWLQHVIKPKREPTTYETYEILVRVHIDPALGHIRLGRLLTEDVEGWLEDLERRGTGVRTRQSALIRLRTALNVALARRRIGTNPAEHVEAPKTGKKAKRTPPNPTEARKLLSALAGDPMMRAFVLLWLGVGLRRGETLGLRWKQDLDLERGYVLVQQRVNRVRELGLLVREGPKSDESNKAVPLPNLVVRALQDWQLAQRDEQQRAGDRWKGTAQGYVFTSTVGTLIEPRNVNRAFDVVLNKAGLVHRTPHSLRHDFAGLLLLGGVPNRVTQEMMRHTSYGLTANVYQSPPDELQRLGAAVIDQILGSSA
jgi:integrase